MFEHVSQGGTSGAVEGSKTEEQKAEALAARQAESTAAGIAYRASRPKPPKEANALSAVAAALAAKEAGRGFYEVQLDVAHSERGVELAAQTLRGTASPPATSTPSVKSKQSGGG